MNRELQEDGAGKQKAERLRLLEASEPRGWEARRPGGQEALTNTANHMYSWSLSVNTIFSHGPQLLCLQGKNGAV